MLHTPIIDDPEVTAAVVDFRDTVIAIRGHSLRLFQLPEDRGDRAAEQEAVDQAVADMQSRCDRIRTTLDELFRLINLDLVGSGSAPRGDFLYEITRASSDARIAEADAHLALTAAQQQLRTATDARIAADRQCAGYAADWMIR